MFSVIQWPYCTYPSSVLYAAVILRSAHATEWKIVIGRTKDMQA